MASELDFSLNINREKALLYYQGKAHSIIVRADNGKKIQFPAKHIRPFIDQNGIHGYFRIQFDDNHKFLGLSRIR